jgi:hypothetical protein
LVQAHSVLKVLPSLTFYQVNIKERERDKNTTSEHYGDSVWFEYEMLPSDSCADCLELSGGDGGNVRRYALAGESRSLGTGP